MLPTKRFEASLPGASMYQYYHALRIQTQHHNPALPIQNPADTSAFCNVSEGEEEKEISSASSDEEHDRKRSALKKDAIPKKKTRATAVQPPSNATLFNINYATEAAERTPATTKKQQTPQWFATQGN